MDINLMNDDSKLATTSNPSKTLVLVGRTGNGMSAIGNSILGRKAFISRQSHLSVTSTCQSQRVVQDDGQVINVIDTPGMFSLSTEEDSTSKEIERCITLAEDGIHALLLVFSVRDRVRNEDRSVFSHMQTLFGSKIVNYMIIVFTGGDELEEYGETLEDYLAQGGPEFLKEIFELCGNRMVLFDNKTKDNVKKVEQVQKLLALVDLVAKQNNGQPYTEELFNELQVGKATLREKEKKLEQKLDEEKNARLEVKDRANEVQKHTRDEFKRLGENLERAEKESKEL